jgi:hypothetical protein
MSAFYVDFVDGDVWSAPCDLDPQKCADEVIDAVNDYTLARMRIDEAATVHEDHRLAEAVAASGGPVLPPSPRISIEASLPSAAASPRAGAVQTAEVINLTNTLRVLAIMLVMIIVAITIALMLWK